MNKPVMILLFSDASGQFIPQRFANEMVRDCVSGVDADTWEILEAGPDHEWYWEAWDQVLRDAVATDNGVRYRVDQDGDCWLIPEGMAFDDREGYYWPTDEAALTGAQS